MASGSRGTGSAFKRVRVCMAAQNVRLFRVRRKRAGGGVNSKLTATTPINLREILETRSALLRLGCCETTVSKERPYNAR